MISGHDQNPPSQARQLCPRKGVAFVASVIAYVAGDEYGIDWTDRIEAIYQMIDPRSQQRPRIDNPGCQRTGRHHVEVRSEEHTSELQSLMRSSYAVICLKKKKHTLHSTPTQRHQQQIT